MILLRLISLPYVRKHLLRSVLTTAGIVLGVALLVGMQTAKSRCCAFSIAAEMATIDGAPSNPESVE